MTYLLFFQNKKFFQNTKFDLFITKLQKIMTYYYKIFSIGFQIKYLVLSNCSEHAQIGIQWHQNSFFQKITKNNPVAGGFALRPASVIRLSYTSLLTHVFYFGHFRSLTIGLNPTFHFANTQLNAKLRPWLNIVPQKVPLSKISDHDIACDL